MWKYNKGNQASCDQFKSLTNGCNRMSGIILYLWNRGRFTSCCSSSCSSSWTPKLYMGRSLLKYPLQFMRDSVLSEIRVSVEHTEIAVIANRSLNAVDKLMYIWVDPIEVNHRAHCSGRSAFFKIRPTSLASSLFISGIGFEKFISVYFCFEINTN